MLESPNAWIAVIRFAESVLTAKEVAECERMLFHPVVVELEDGARPWLLSYFIFYCI